MVEMKTILIVIFTTIAILFGIMTLPRLNDKARSKIISRTANYLYPEYGSCYKCNLPWSIVANHNTYYTKSNGCFPLCEKCWKGLGSPENRMPYYMKLVDYWDWLRDCTDEETREEIRTAVNSWK